MIDNHLIFKSLKNHAFSSLNLTFFFGLAMGLGFWGCQNPTQRPAAGIALSFDDRYIEDWTRLRPLLQKYNAHVTFYVTQFDSLSAHEIQLLHQLQQDGHEIGAHGAMHVRILDWLRGGGSLEDFYKQEIEGEVRSMQKAGFRPVTFAHVGGQQTWWTDRRLLKDYFVLLRDVAICDRKLLFINLHRAVFDIDEIYYQFDNDRTVHALLIDQMAGLTNEALKDGLIRAKNTQSVLMLFGHRPLFEPSSEPYAFSVKQLEFILAEAQRMNLKTYTMRELVQ
ncbi:MAG: polysaccharide deacetylase family protein [Runella sp.]